MSADLNRLTLGVSPTTHAFESGCPDCGGIGQHAEDCPWHGLGTVFDEDGAGRQVAPDEVVDGADLPDAGTALRGAP